MTDTIWYIIHAIVAAVAFPVGFRITAEIREWRDNTRNIEREIPFPLFLEAYGKAPDRWKLLPYCVRYGADDVRFENYADYRKYKKWREKRKRDAEAERKRSMNERLFREIQSDLMPTPPTTGTNVIKPKRRWDSLDEDDADFEKTIRYAVEHECSYHAAKLALASVCKPEDESIHDCIDAKCGICRQFDKGDNSPFGYCFRNDEIVNETSVKGCFEPKSKAEERPEPLGTVTTH